MKKIVIIIVSLLLSFPGWCQYTKVTFGLRGGSCMYLTDIVQPAFGYQGLLDFDFIHYWRLSRCEVGIKSGLSAGYSASSLRGDATDLFTNIDYLGYEMRYQTSGHLEQVVQQVQFEIPFMFALRANGFIWNIGAKLMTPVWSSCTQEAYNVKIDAFYPITDVHVTNELITGKIPQEYTSKEDNALPFVHVLVGTELGYEWARNNHRIGLVLYGDMAPWCLHKASDKPLVEVAPIQDPSYPPAQVTIHPLMDAASRLMYIDFGLKFYYGINIID